eukprot:1052412-Rhodomonas_salina.1
MVVPGAKARYLKNDQTVMYTIGLRSPTEIEAGSPPFFDTFDLRVSGSDLGAVAPRRWMFCSGMNSSTK